MDHKRAKPAFLRMALGQMNQHVQTESPRSR